MGSPEVLSTGILLGTFILSIAIDMNNGIENLKYLTPYKYFEAKKLMFGQGYNAGYMIISAVLVSVLIKLTFEAYMKRDLKV